MALLALLQVSNNIVIIGDLLFMLNKSGHLLTVNLI